MPAQVGSPFPPFSLPNQDGKVLQLGDFAGKWLVVYVYPKDDTPGCTIQGKAFTATKQEYDAAGIRVVGVSADDVASRVDAERLGADRPGDIEWRVISITQPETVKRQ